MPGGVIMGGVGVPGMLSDSGETANFRLMGAIVNSVLILPAAAWHLHELGGDESSVRNGCVRNVNSGSCLSPWLGTERSVTMTGSSYFDILSCSVRPMLCERDDWVPDIAKIKSDLLGTEGNCEDTIEPDVLAMGDGIFSHVGDVVPQDKVDKLYELAGEYTTAPETRDLNKRNEINLAVADDLLEFTVKEQDINPEWL